MRDMEDITSAACRASASAPGAANVRHARKLGQSGGGGGSGSSRGSGGGAMEELEVQKDGNVKPSTQKA